MSVGYITICKGDKNRSGVTLAIQEHCGFGFERVGREHSFRRSIYRQRSGRYFPQRPRVWTGHHAMEVPEILFLDIIRARQQY